MQSRMAEIATATMVPVVQGVVHLQGGQMILATYVASISWARAS